MSHSSGALAYMPAHRQLQLFRTKELSPVDVLKAQIARAEAAGDRINAFTYRHFEEGLKAAKEAGTFAVIPVLSEAFRSR